MSYCVRNSTHAIIAQRTFEKVCQKIQSGEMAGIKDDNGNLIPGEITTERFKMAYARLDPNDALYKCRLQLPKYWFVSKDGIVITLSGSKPKWYNRGNSAGRNDRELQLKINTSATGRFSQRKEDGTEKPVTIYNYTLVAIVYNALLVGEPEDIDNIKTYGLEVFGRKNSGNSVRQAEEDSEEKKGLRGLVINGEEKIKPDNMMDVHHIKGTEYIQPEYLEIMPHWLHEYLKYYTASVSTAEELFNLIKKDTRAFAKINRMFPNKWIVIDYSKTVSLDGNENVYVHYNGINESIPNQVDARYYKYFKIAPYNGEDIKQLFFGGALYDNGEYFQVVPQKLTMTFYVKVILGEAEYDFRFKYLKGDLIHFNCIKNLFEKEECKDFLYTTLIYDSFNKAINLFDGDVKTLRANKATVSISVLDVEYTITRIRDEQHDYIVLDNPKNLRKT